jgi:hypothetical protein
LARSDDDGVVKIGAWLLSELGSKASEVLDIAELMLDHRLRDARYYAIETVLAAATNKDGSLLAKAAMRIEDDDRAVRHMAMRFLAREGRGQLAMALPFLADSNISGLLTWLIGVGDDPEKAREIIDRSDNGTWLSRAFAVVAAARIAGSNPSALEHACVLADWELREFGNDELSILRMIRKQSLRRSVAREGQDK